MADTETLPEFEHRESGVLGACGVERVNAEGAETLRAQSLKSEKEGRGFLLINLESICVVR